MTSPDRGYYYSERKEDNKVSHINDRKAGRQTVTVYDLTLTEKPSFLNSLAQSERRRS